MEQRTSRGHDMPPTQNVEPKPMTLADRLRLMIIRIGDEKREQKDDHIKKLKAVILQEETLKNHKETVLDTLTKCVLNMPHKSLIYATIVASIAVENEQFANEIVQRVGELLQESLVQQMDVFTAKNILRFMGSLVDLKLLSSLSFSQMITNLLEEQAKSQYHSLDLVLESVMAGLPLAAPRLKKEQPIEFGTVLESLKLLFQTRERQMTTTCRALSPFSDLSSKDLLQQMWDFFSVKVDKTFNYEQVMLAASQEFQNEIRNKLTGKVSTIETIALTEFVPQQKSFKLLIEGKLKNQEKHYSPYLLGAIETGVEDLFEFTTATDIIMSVLTAFQDSQAMAAHNLQHLYLGESLRGSLSPLIVNAIFSQLMKLPKLDTKPIFFQAVVQSLINQSGASPDFKNFQQQVEEALANIFAKMHLLDTELQVRLLDFTGVFISQRDFKCDSILQKFETKGITAQSEKWMRQLFEMLTRMSYSKKLQQSIDQKYHHYIVDDKTMQEPTFKYANESGDNPDAQFVLDQLNAKEQAKTLKAMFEDKTKIEASGEQLKDIFLECILFKSRKSLEHLKKFVEIYSEIFYPFYKGEPVSQRHAVTTIVEGWKNNQVRATNIIERLYQLGLLELLNVIQWAFQSLIQKQTIERDAIEFKIINLALMRATSRPQLLVTQFKQRGQTQDQGQEEQDQQGPLMQVKPQTEEEFQTEYHNIVEENAHLFRITGEGYTSLMDKNQSEELIGQFMQLGRAFRKQFDAYLAQLGEAVKSERGKEALAILQAL